MNARAALVTGVAGGISGWATAAALVEDGWGGWSARRAGGTPCAANLDGIRQS